MLRPFDNIDGFSLTYKKGIPFITDDRLTALGVEHGFTTRQGGVSRGNFESFNLAYSPERDDYIYNVEKNYDLLLDAFDTPPDKAVKTNQTHTDCVRCADGDGGVGFTLPFYQSGVDGLVCRSDGMLLTARMADCLPILLYDKFNGAVGAIHSGWKGSIMQIGTKAVELMCRLYGSNKSDILVSFGPSIASCCYRVGEEFVQNFINAHTDRIACAFKKTSDGWYADMTLVNRILLTESGVPAENIAVFPLCTCCNPRFFFSYRRQKTQRGTMAAVIKCKSQN